MAATKAAEYITDAYRNSPDRDILTPEGCRHLIHVGEKAISYLVDAGMPAVPISNSYRFVRHRVIEWMANEGEQVLKQLRDSSTTKDDQ